MQADEIVEEPHLTPEEVVQILRFVEHCNPIVVGGQSINIWSELYEGKDAALDELGSLTSKDIDFYQNKEAQTTLVSRLDEGKLHIPDADDHTPNASVVVGKLGDRKVEVDFLATVQGIPGNDLEKNAMGVELKAGGVVAQLMHPLDCVKSRLANINSLKRFTEHSVVQAIASVRILDCFIDDLLRLGDEGHKMVTDILAKLEYVIRDNYLGREAYLKFGDRLELDAILRRYLDDERLDSRFRDKQLSGIIRRVDRKIALVARRHSPEENEAVVEEEVGEPFSPRRPRGAI
jgi:hypothetical protein